jgi:hypothetical protein
MDYLRTEIVDGVAVITLADPDRRNALNLDMNAEIVATLDRVEADELGEAAHTITTSVHARVIPRRGAMVKVREREREDERHDEDRCYGEDPTHDLQYETCFVIHQRTLQLVWQLAQAITASSGPTA